MTIKTRIMAAFAIGAIAGTVLGILLNSQEGAKAGGIGKDANKRGSLMDWLFPNKGKKGFVQTANETVNEYEQA